MPAGLFHCDCKVSRMHGSSRPFLKKSTNLIPHGRAPSTPQCASQHSHISPDPNATPHRRQPPLTHNHPKPASKASSTPHRPQCASHHSHIADSPTLPKDNNRGKQPLPQVHHQTSTPPTPAMCQSPLTHRPGPKRNSHLSASRHSHITTRNLHPKHHPPHIVRNVQADPHT